jgi:hypothetical protein
MSSNSVGKCAALSLLVLGTSVARPVFPTELVVVERMTISENFRFFSLEVDGGGMLYFGSPDVIVKLRPDGRRVFELRAAEHGLRSFIDFGVAPSGELVVIGGASDTGARLVTRGLIFDGEGHLRRSFEVPEFMAETVEAGAGGEVFLAGVRASEYLGASKARVWIYRLGADGRVLAAFSTGEMKEKGRAISRNRRLVVRGRELYWLSPETLRLQRFSLEGERRGEKNLRLADLKPLTERSGASRSRVDYCALLDPAHVLLAVVTQDSGWQKRALKGGSWVAFQPFTYTLYLVSREGTGVEPIQVENVGALRAVGRDGFLYFVRTITTEAGTKTEVVKAALR